MLSLEKLAETKVSAREVAGVKVMQIVSAKVKTENSYLQMFVELQTKGLENGAIRIISFISVNENDSENEKEKAYDNIKRFCECFSVPPEEFIKKPGSMVGKEGRIMLFQPACYRIYPNELLIPAEPDELFNQLSHLYD